MLLLVAVFLGACDSSQPQRSEQDASVTATNEAATSGQSQARPSREPAASDAPDDDEQNTSQSEDHPDVGGHEPANGICQRHEHVQREILWTLGMDDCADVSDDDLASIDGDLILNDHYAFTSIDAGDLRGLSSLQKLSMSLNLSSLPAGLFDDLTSLRELRLYVEGRRPALPAGLFDRLTSLEELILQTGTQRADMFSNLKRLRKLWLLGGGLVEGSVNHLSRLEELIVRGGIWLKADALNGLTGLKVLYLDDNGITEIESGAFDDLTSLEFLNLRNNSINTLPEGVFDGLVALDDLWLYGNPLTALPPGVFDHLTSLTSLQLGTGMMESLDPDVFGGLRGLRELALFGDNLSELPTGLLAPLSNLYWLDLRWPGTSGLPPELFVGLEQLTFVHLSSYAESLPPLTVALRKIDSNSLVINVAEGSPFQLAVYLKADGGTLSSRRVTVPAGQTSSEVVHVEPGESGPVQISVSSWSFPENYVYEGFTVAPPEEWEPLVFSPE